MVSDAEKRNIQNLLSQAEAALKVAIDSQAQLRRLGENAEADALNKEIADTQNKIRLYRQEFGIQ